LEAKEARKPGSQEARKPGSQIPELVAYVVFAAVQSASLRLTRFSAGEGRLLPRAANPHAERPC
jgi:hypothetical protein